MGEYAYILTFTHTRMLSEMLIEHLMLNILLACAWNYWAVSVDTGYQRATRLVTDQQSVLGTVGNFWAATYWSVVAVVESSCDILSLRPVQVLSIGYMTLLSSGSIAGLSPPLHI